MAEKHVAMPRQVHREVAPNDRCRLMCGCSLLQVRLCSVRNATLIMNPNNRGPRQGARIREVLCENREIFGERNDRERGYGRGDAGGCDDEGVQGPEST